MTQTFRDRWPLALLAVPVLLTALPASRRWLIRIVQSVNPRAGATGKEGMTLPLVGLGTMGLESKAAVRSALDTGYRLLDCAPVYFNEVMVGDALVEAIEAGDVRREDVWITSKLACPFHRAEHVEQALRKTLTDLRVSYLDLFLIHWPIAFKYVPINPKVRGWTNEDIDDSAGGSNIDPTVSVQETWKALEKLQRAGLVRHIGVSNFPVALLHELMANCEIKPYVNQVELHPYLQQSKLVDYCAKRQITVQAYSPLGSGGYKEDWEPSVLSDPSLRELAKKKGVTVAQLCLAWLHQRGVAVVAKSSSAQRQAENIYLYYKDSLVLSQQDMDVIAGLDRGHRFFRPDDWWGDMGAVFS